MHKKCSALLLLFMLASCFNSSEEVYMKNLNGNWNKNAQQNFDFTVKDAQNAKNIIFVVRNNNDYPYSNIRFFVNFLDQTTKKSTTDTVNYVLAKPDGEWIGTGFGDTKETLFQYRLNYKFPKNGPYSIGIKHAMRTDSLKGIEDIGVKIETAKP